MLANARIRVESLGGLSELRRGVELRIGLNRIVGGRIERSLVVVVMDLAIV